MLRNIIQSREEEEIRGIMAFRRVRHSHEVVVKGSDDVDYMIKVIGALQQLDITKVGLATSD